MSKKTTKKTSKKVAKTSKVKAIKTPITVEEYLDEDIEDTNINEQQVEEILEAEAPEVLQPLENEYTLKPNTPPKKEKEAGRVLLSSIQKELGEYADDISDSFNTYTKEQLWNAAVQIAISWAKKANEPSQYAFKFISLLAIKRNIIDHSVNDGYIQTLLTRYIKFNLKREEAELKATMFQEEVDTVVTQLNSSPKSFDSKPKKATEHTKTKVIEVREITPASEEIKEQAIEWAEQIMEEIK